MNDTEDPRDGDDVDTWEPIAELAELREEPGPGFRKRIKNSIQRRVFLADTVDFSLMAFFETLMDYIEAMIQMVVGPGAKGGGDDKP